MLEPPAAAALAVVVRALADEADGLALPEPLLDGWVSFAAHEYQSAIARSRIRLLQLRAALHAAVRALEPFR